MGIDGLKKAVELCRTREAEWRSLGESGGSDAHPEHDCWCRAYEAMTCANVIEEAIDDIATMEDLGKFANLDAVTAREECAKVCDEIAEHYGDDGGNVAEHCAISIRMLSK